MIKKLRLRRAGRVSVHDEARRKVRRVLLCTSGDVVHGSGGGDDDSQP
jgi:hypothetical protein